MNWKKRILLLLVPSAIMSVGSTFAQPNTSLEEVFLSPKREHRPLLIWQWMDGLVTKEGITRDLEAFKEAGIAGVQNFQIGGPDQMRIGNPDNAIGSDNWKGLLRWTLDECARLGLTFGTHNCPGWSSSAYPSVEPKYSMQQLVYSESGIDMKSKSMSLPLPEIDDKWNYYEDVAVLAVPEDSVCKYEEIINLTDYFNPATSMLQIPDNIKLGQSVKIMRIGQTTNGKTNEAQAPESGRGLECDKLSREAVRHFWEGYPTMVLEVAGNYVGNTFTHFEIDSYEAGGQTWSPALPQEFRKRIGYDLTPFLPYMTGRMKSIESSEDTKRFRKDWEETVKQCVAENYYGYLNQLAKQAGVKMMIEPYGTGGRHPFDILDFYKIVAASPDADIATEFWQDPNWGWRDMGRHESAMRKLQKPLLIAEAFTCWPLRAWQDSPATLKPVCDKAFCTGVNRMMLHAGAANPWPDAEPGMSFGKWGTHFVPGQTWWKAGGAKKLFDYMSRCQALLQQGLPAGTQLPPQSGLKTYHRVDSISNTDIVFVCNPSDSITEGTFTFPTLGRNAELWNPYSSEMYALPKDSVFHIEIEPFGSRFIVIRPGERTKPYITKRENVKTIPVEGEWDIEFPGITAIPTDTLFSWPDSHIDDVKYFSGSATYSITFHIDKKNMPKGGNRIILNLGKVENMANVCLNGVPVDLLWKEPYTCDITPLVKKGKNTLSVEVTNLWPNRMIGDEQYPDDLEWSEPEIYTYANPPAEIGRYLLSQPDWLINGTPRPSPNRKTVGCFKFFKKGSPLLPSGLLGPVTLSIEK